MEDSQPNRPSTPEAAGARYARPANSRVSVCTFTFSPSLMNRGTRTSRPVSSVAALVTPPLAVSPLTPGSVDTTVSSGERIYFSGVYPGGEGAILWLQRWQDGAWADFPASVGVTNGTFSSYIFTGVSGLNRFRVIDRDDGTVSNEIRVTVG